MAIKTITHWINGKSWERPLERKGDVFNPATGEKTAELALASPAEVDAAVSAAKAASAAWRVSSLTKRTRILFAFRELVDKRKQEIAQLLTAEHGKVASDALGEVNRGIEVIEFACGIPHLLKGEFSENVSTEVDVYSIRQPVGVVAGITPFNFPAMVPMWMYPIAIACGNTFVLKPSERDPSAAHIAGELFKQAGLPDGVFNIVHGDKVAVDRLIEHPDVGALSFVGSTPIAKYIYEGGTRHGKRVQALGGAKNHMVLLPDADMELAADAAIGAAYGSAGERCMAISVLVAVGSAGDKIIPMLRQRIARLKTGDGSKPGMEMGPIVTRAALERIKGLVDKGVAEGAKLLEDGREPKIAGNEQGFFIKPCLFDQVKPEMSVYQEEIFGPVLAVVRVGTYDEAIKLVQANPYANGVAIFTNDGGAARKFQNEIEVGMVGVNVPIPVPMAYFSFGGWKASLFGDTHVHGMDGVRFYTRNKVITSRWPDPRFRGVNLGFPENS
jgi:malonate-semialdehyde dehydrogenase (acetylating)/methylmalonate-semialdehyde dehydrogenase